MDTTSESGPTGTLLEGRYEVGELLARGGMSLVHRGVDTRLGRPVAIKMMKREFADDPTFLARFEREARAAATLDHPGIVAVYDQGRDGDHVFLVMELVDGGTLRDLIRQEGGPLPLPVALTVLEQILAALAVAHEAGLVHRDVKPENVLISSKGEVKVADFGLVRAVTSMTQATGDVILGTVAYLSPEQVATGASDQRSDVYAAGIVAYEMLTGHPPFSGENAMSVAYQHVHADVPAPSAENPEVPRAIDSLIQDATSRDPDSRPASAGDFLAESIALRAELGVRRVLVPTPVARATPPASASPSTRTTVRPDGPQGTRAVPVGHLLPQATAVGAPPGMLPEEPAAPAGRRGVRSPKPPLTRAQLRRRNRLIAAIVVAVLGIGAAVFGWWMGAGRWTSLPELDGRPVAEAEASLRSADLVPVLTTAPDDEVPTGRVVSTDPPAGTRALRDTTVSVLVSAGRPTVPAVEPGTSQAAARSSIMAAALQVAPGVRTVPHETVPAGAVITTDPAPGTVIRIDSTVTLVVSSGPAPLTVPEVLGKEVEDAENKLIASGFAIGEPIERFDPQEPAGTVLGTEPAAGDTAAKGAAVSLVLSNSLTVPSVTGRPEAAAKATLIEAGFTPVAGGTRFSATVDAGSVVLTRPGVGALVDPDAATIEVVLSNAVTLPDLRGRSIDDARAALLDLDLEVQANTPWFFGSTVRSQTPGGGTRVEPGSTVRISTVS